MRQWCSSASKAGGSWASLPSHTTARSASGWPSGRSSSAPGSNAGSISFRRSGGPCASGGFRTRKARLIARYADKASVDVWIDCATRMTCIGLRRSLEGAKEAQMCARRMLGMPMPLRVLELAEVALRAARREAGRWIPPGECLRMIAEHFCAVWEPILEGKSTVQKEVLERDRGLCQVPGCSRIAAHAHHIQFRSAGGGDEPENLVSLCAAHHLQCVHNGWVRVTGKAPDQLRWQLGVRPGRAPLLEFVSTPA